MPTASNRFDILRRGGHCKQYEWMFNEQGKDPCMLVKQVCTVERLGAVSGDLSCPSSDNPQGCCCSVATYALLSACWVCQGHDPAEIDIAIRPSYFDFFQESGCPSDMVANFSIPQPQSQSVDIPQWAWLQPNNLSDRWNLTNAQVNATAIELSPNSSQYTSSTVTLPSPVPISASPQAPTASVSSHSSSKSATSPGTIAASVVGSTSLVAIAVAGAWIICRWRRRRVIRRNRGVKVDLIEPEMTEPGATANAALPRGNGMFPFPYEGVVPRYHPNMQYSIEPSRSDDSTVPDEQRDADMRTMARHRAPVPSLRTPMDQLDKDLARLQGVGNPSISQLDFKALSTSQSHIDDQLTSPGGGGLRLGEGQGQVHHHHQRRAASITTFTHSSQSGSTSSHRARRKSENGNAISQGRYYHLPPSAQYLENVARYPGRVDPERPWDIRRDART